MIDKIFAKSKENGKIKLVGHSIAVINVSVYLFNQIIKKEINFNEIGKESPKKFKQELILTAALHDIGKCSRKFQEKLNKFELTDDGNYIMHKTKKDSSHFIPHNVSGWVSKKPKTVKETFGSKTYECEITSAFEITAMGYCKSHPLSAVELPSMRYSSHRYSVYVSCP